jgi:carbon catabolite-derepressing protein kinase
VLIGKCPRSAKQAAKAVRAVEAAPKHRKNGPNPNPAHAATLEAPQSHPTTPPTKRTLAATPLAANHSLYETDEKRGREKKSYNHTNDWGYHIPEDPWVINARFRKDGMFPPGVAHPSSTHSSRVDLANDPSGLRRRSSTNTSTSSLGHGIEGMTITERGTSIGGSDEYPNPDEAVWIYVSIQLYSIDRDFFVVDFKCAGYERLVSNLVREVKAASNPLSTSSPKHEDGWDDEAGVWRRLDEGEPLPDDLAKELSKGQKGVLRERHEEVGAGRKEGEKVVTSPFPFLDVASTLILQLSGE